MPETSGVMQNSVASVFSAAAAESFNLEPEDLVGKMDQMTSSIASLASLSAI
jgi:hypothetical protein